MVTEVKDPEVKTADILGRFVATYDPKLPIYTMWFRRGNRQPEIKSFQLDGTLTKAINRSRAYCEKMGYRFCGTYPFLYDLDKEEKAHADGTYISEGI